MVLVTISFSARDETTDFVGFVWLKTSVACNKMKKTVISNHWNETFLPRLRGRLGAVALLSEVFLRVFFYLIIEWSIVLLKLDSF